MASKRKYNQWKKDPNLSIPKRTLARLKKNAAMATCTSETFISDVVEVETVEDIERNDNVICGLTDVGSSSQTVDSIDSSDEACVSDENFDLDLAEQTSIIINVESGEDHAYDSDTLCENQDEPCHLIEDSEFRDNNMDELNMSESETYDSSDEDDSNKDNVNTEYLYPGSSITIQDSILSIMKYSLRHKTTYAALSDLLSLIILHLPHDSHKEHLQSLYFLKKAFVAQTVVQGEAEKPDIAKIQNSYQILTMHGFSERKRVKKSLQNAERSWHDVMDGDLYRELLKPGGFLDNDTNLSLLFNTDGVHVFKSSKGEIWPLLVVVNEVHPSVRFSTKRIILAGIWFGSKKPPMATFLAPFREQLNHLYHTGVLIASKNITCHAVTLIGTTDLPAKAACQEFTQFNGECGCSFCEDKGVIVSVGKGHSRAYPFIPGPPRMLRTKDKVLKQGTMALQSGTRVCGVKMVSQLTLVDGFDIIRGMPLDYMHSVLLGVVKMLFSKWFDAKNKKEVFYIGDKISCLDGRLCLCQPPDYISRLPRSLADRKYWKASEVRSWLLYYSLPVLHGILPDELYCHYALLATSVYHLLQQPVTQSGLLSADRQLEEFYALMSKYYGESACTMNVHNVCKHMTTSVKLAGPLWAFSCFGTESWNGTMMKLIHGTHHVATQVVAAIKSIRLVNIEQKQQFDDDLSRETSIFFANLTRPIRNNCQNLFKGCYSVGGMNKVVLDFQQLAELNELIFGAAVNVEQAYNFKKAIYKKQMFYSKLCTNIKKRNSYTITYLASNGEEKFGQILYFLKVSMAETFGENNEYCVAAIEELQPC
ncbi:Hypothetical predicted protein [Paramuricea clavata]|uniref:Uncharacterized protein n=1 Tax=Paramuricea clavata TaxID=317549 RepID=A0A7D9DHK2_PARCT|nr:Hypothetical predicted protein [Paramuricea clavata]